ncbi:MAG: hypothetical protein ACO25M_01300 [Limnohabitans sp.]
MTAPTLFPTTLVGSYPQPSWLVDKEQLARRVPRIRDHDLWRVPAAQLQEAMEDATRVVIRAHAGDRHRDRRRGAPGELFQPICHRIRRY